MSKDDEVDSEKYYVRHRKTIFGKLFKSLVKPDA